MARKPSTGSRSRSTKKDEASNEKPKRAASSRKPAAKETAETNT
jgi:hypothetical protein